MDKNKLLEQLKGGLIVSCQALEHEPLHSSFIMSRMALAAKMGGAVGIRANTYQDITEIKRVVELPVIGIVKRDYPDSSIYITPTMDEVNEVKCARAEIIALDATNRLRPQQETLAEIYTKIRTTYPDSILMADVSTFEEGIYASELGFDIVGTTLSGYTDYTKESPNPNIDLVGRLANAISTPIFAEGGYSSVDEVREAIKAGAHACVVGGAITRPMEITKRFVSGLQSIEGER